MTKRSRFEIKMDEEAQALSSCAIECSDVAGKFG
jgi:hypothetical protein